MTGIAGAILVLMYLFAIAGLALLLVGGEVLVRGAVSMAEKFRVPPLVIGLTVVAFGTSSPELMVSINAALSGVPTMAVGNVVGSNIANILLVLGLPALIYPIACNVANIDRDAGIMLVVSVMFVGLCWTGNIVMWHGIIMVLLLLGYLTWSYLNAARGGASEADELSETEAAAVDKHNLPLALLFIVGGIAGLVFGSDLLIDGATAIAKSFGVSDAVIGLTLIAVGTSLPELATSIIAAFKKHSEIALGNVVGSNLFNILAILGITAVVHDLPVPPEFLSYDLWVMLAASAFLTFFAFRHLSINRLFGAILLLAYSGYIFSLLASSSGNMTTALVQ